MNQHQNIIRLTFICFTLLRSCSTKNSFSDIDLSTQTLNPSFMMMTGNAAGDRLGYQVSTAGDINNDGYDDIIVGAYYKDSQKGASYIIYGGEESSFLNIDLSTTSLNPLTTGFMVTGNAAGDGFGWSVSTAGDVNNDGYDDIIVGAYTKSSSKGAAYVIYGGAKSTMSNINLSSTTLDPLLTGFMITGNAANDWFGFSVSTAGDINNDGYDDIIIGAHSKSSSKGAVYVVYGGAKSSMSNWDLSSGAILNPSMTGFMITGNAAGDGFGYSVSTAGDINDDGYDDIIVGARIKNSNQGAVYVIYGGPKSSMSNLALSSTSLDPLATGFTIIGNAVGDWFGSTVSLAGDINNDGYDDIIIGAEYKNSLQGAAYVIYGGAKSSMSNWDLSSSATLNPSTTGFMIKGNAPGDYFGKTVRTAGDINNDGYNDMIVGAWGKNSQQGATYVIYGGEKSAMSNIDLSTTTLDPVTTGFVITGNAVSDHFGWSVSSGDINNDGFNDIIVGAYAKSSSKGAAYVIYVASCSPNCKQCSSEPVCTQCKNSYLMYKSECFASCPDATFATSATECEGTLLSGFNLTMITDCPNHCNHCNSTSICTECISPFVLYESECFASCPKAMFNSHNECKECPSYCSSCISQDSCQVCFQGYTLSNALCVLSSDSSQQKATQAISSATQGIGSLVCVGSAIVPFSALVSKIVQNTRYLNLTVTSDLSDVYKTWSTELISWDVPNVMSDLDDFKTSPSLFAQYNLGSPFLVNFWPTLLNIGIGFGTFIVFILLQSFFEQRKYEGWAHSLVRKLVAGSFNFTLIQAYACLDDILFYLVLDAKTNPFKTFFSRASIVCAVIFLVLGCLIVFFNFWTVKKYQSIKKQGANSIEAFNENNKYWELFYSDFNDDDLYTQSFFAILIIRSTLSSFTIAVLYDYPLMQTAYFVIMDLAILSFLYFKTPFNTLRGTLSQYYYEIITLLVHLCTFILSLQDTFEAPSDTVQLVFSTSIIYLNTALISGAIGFMFIEIYLTISEKTKAGNLKQYENIAIQTASNDILTTTIQDQSLKTETHSYANQHQAYENLHLFSGINHTEQSGFNMDFSHILESNFNAENSRELDMSPSQQGDQRIAPITIQRKRRILKQKRR